MRRVADDQGEPLPGVGVPAGLFHPVTVKQGGWLGVARDGLVEDPGEDRLLGPERLVDVAGATAAFRAMASMVVAMYPRSRNSPSAASATR